MLLYFLPFISHFFPFDLRTNTVINIITIIIAIIVKNINKSFGSLHVLKGINLEVEKGELLTLLGPSGCGKSTLLRCLAGLEEVQEGQIFLEDQDITNLDARLRQIGMVFQQYSLFPNMTVEQNLAFGLKIQKLSKEEMKEEITALEEDDLYNNIEFPLAQVLADMTRTGMLVDREGIETFGVRLREKIDGALAAIQRQVDDPAFNPNSPKQLGELLFDKMHLPHGRKTSRGWSTDNATLQKLRPDCPLIDDILEYRSYQKLYSTYVEGLLKVIGPDGRIHSTFNQTEARTGRLSSDNPNLQNIPIRTELGSQLRGFFIAKPGCVLVDADYSQIELRILAHITGDEHMQEAFRSGQDIHRSTAAKIYGIPLEEVTPRLRTAAKAINFGIMYGKGAFSLSEDLGVSMREAGTFLKNYLDSFPKVDGYMEKTIADAKEKGYVSTLFGRRRALPELSSSNFAVRTSGERMARNTPIQGTAADVIKLAMVRVWRRLRAEKLESRLILTVHDELIVEAPEAEAGTAARILKEEMEGCVQFAVPLETDVRQGKSWLEAH